MKLCQDAVRRHGKFAYKCSDEPLAEEFKKYISIEDTETAEREFAEILKLVSDTELREKLDSAAGRISHAYEKLGFMVGYILERSMSDPF